MDLLVDVSFESQDLDTAALLRGEMSSLRIHPSMTAHTVAGYIFTGLGVHKDIDREVHGQFGPIISHDMAEIIRSVPSLKDVRLKGAALHSDFYAVLAKEGNKSKVHTVMLDGVRCPTTASSHYLADALCSMPNLTRLILYKQDFKEEFYSALNAKASTLQVHTVQLYGISCPTSASSHYLVDALCSMPNLTHLILYGKEFKEEFYSTLNAKVSTLQDSFPQISNGNFMFNGEYQADFDSFLQSLTDFRRRNYVSDEEDNFSDEEDGVSDEEDGVSDEEDGVSDEEDGVSDEEDGVSDEEDGVSEEEDGVSEEEDGVSDQEDGVSDQEDGVSDEEENVLDEDDNTSDEEDNVLDEDDNTADEEDNVSDEKRLGKGDINLVDRKQSSFEVKPLESGASQKFLKFTLDQKPEFTLPYDDMETTRTTAEAQAAWVSTLSQTLPPSDYPQQYVGNTSDTSDTVCQLSQTYAEGSSGLSRPCKRQAPSTQSRVPQDDPEIPEKQSKIDLESDRILNTLSKHMPPATYATLCTHLGIGYDQANAILARFNMDYQRATRDCLAQWKTRTSGNIAQLKAILVDAEVGDLVKYIE